jgi:hypothetical protein
MALATGYATAEARAKDKQDSGVKRCTTRSHDGLTNDMRRMERAIDSTASGATKRRRNQGSGTLIFADVR